MKTLVTAFLSFLTLVTSAFSPVKNSVPVPKDTDNNPQEVNRMVTPTDKAAVAVSVTPSGKPSQGVTQGTQPSAVKTPTNVFSKIGEDYFWVVTMRPGERIALQVISPMKGSQTLGIDLPPSGAPAGVFLTQDQANDRTIFINTGPSVVPGKYQWRQKFTARFTSGVAPGDLSFGVILTVLP